MKVLAITPEEKAAGAFSPSRLAEARQAIIDDGAVVLENAAEVSHIEAIRERMLADIPLLLARKDRPFNWNTGNLQQDPPPFPPYLFRDVMVNDLIIQVTGSVLGKGQKSAFYSGNTALPSKDRQPVHADVGQLWPGLEVAHPPYALVINFPLVDVSAENGSTEIWLGTHKDTSIVMQDGDIKVSAEALEAQRAISPPIQPEVKAGSAVIRDIRMWHAGMPNHTDAPRPMIALIHHVNWWPTGAVRFAKGSEEFLSHPDIWWHAEFLDSVDHISAPGAYEFAESS